MSREDLGGISMLQNDTLITQTEPQALINTLYGETLSLAYHAPSDTVGITTPDANTVSFWKLSTAEYLTAITLPAPRGISVSLDQRYFHVSFGEQASLTQIDASTLKEQHPALRERQFITGSHLYTWAQQA